MTQIFKYSHNRQIYDEYVRGMLVKSVRNTRDGYYSISVLLSALDTIEFLYYYPWIVSVHTYVPNVAYPCDPER